MMWRNWSVRIGGVTLLALVLVAVLAPWLGTVDPTLFDAASRDLVPGAAGEIMTLEGEMRKHTFLMGSDSFGRDVYSRVQFVAYPHNVFFPGIFLALTVLAVNILGDGLRDTLDPKMAKRV